MAPLPSSTLHILPGYKWQVPVQSGYWRTEGCRVVMPMCQSMLSALTTEIVSAVRILRCSFSLARATIEQQRIAHRHSSDLFQSRLFGIFRGDSVNRFHAPGQIIRGVIFGRVVPLVWQLWECSPGEISNEIFEGEIIADMGMDMGVSVIES